MMRRLFDSPYAVVLVLAIVVAVLPLLLPSTFYLRVAALICIFALAVVGLNLLIGFAGQVSLGHAGFFGIGGGFLVVPGLIARSTSGQAVA